MKGKIPSLQNCLSGRILTTFLDKLSSNDYASGYTKEEELFNFDRGFGQKRGESSRFQTEKLNKRFICLIPEKEDDL